MKTDTSICPICKKAATSQSIGPLDQYFRFDCNTCGSFQITDEAIGLLNDDPKIAAKHYKVSVYLRERAIAQRSSVTIVTSRQDIGNDTDKIKGAVVGIDDILAAFPKTISERLDRALQNLSRLSPDLGTKITLEAKKDYPVLFAKNEEEFYFLRDQLVDSNYVEVVNTVPPRFMLTGHGWNRIAELERQKAGKDSKQAFVAMWFDNNLDKARDNGFKKAIKDAGYEPLRIDLKEHNEKICDAIIAEIRKSCFLVADFTGFRSGVFFEAGYALGLRIPVIWTCREDHKDELDRHFDTRQYPHIFWTDESDLYEKLLRRIEATIPAG
jgi:nucleoside 2-deoxyribosyltransferase